MTEHNSAVIHCLHRSLTDVNIFSLFCACHSTVRSPVALLVDSSTHGPRRLITYDFVLYADIVGH